MNNASKRPRRSSSPQQAITNVVPYCAACGREANGNVSLKNCAACKLVKYCGVPCQRAHRSLHKEECKIRAAELEQEATRLTPKLVGMVAKYLGVFGSDLSNLVLSFGCASLRDAAYKAYLEAIRSAVLKDEAYLDEIFDRLPRWRWESSPEANVEPRYLSAAPKIRLWMGMNENWPDRVVSAMMYRAWPVESCSLVRRVTVSGKAAASMRFRDSSPYWCRNQLAPETKIPALEQEYGNILLAVNGEELIDSEDLKDKLKAVGKDRAIDLYFTNRGNVILNNPKAVVHLGLVEVLDKMLIKGYVQANASPNAKYEVPLLWSTYTQSVSDSCFKHMISLPDIDCGSRSGMTFLMYASQHDLPWGLGAYRAIAQHPTAEINAVGESFFRPTALRIVLDKCGRLESNGDNVVSQMKVLIGLGANPIVAGGAAWRTLEYFGSICGEAHGYGPTDYMDYEGVSDDEELDEEERHQSDDEELDEEERHPEILMHDRHYDEIYALLRKALDVRSGRA